MKAYLYSAGHGFHFHWNLDCSVGKNAANSLACDVSYIQWYYTLAAQHPSTPADRKAVYQKVRVTGSCQGTDDDPLVVAILVHQRHLNHPQIDGKISVVQGPGKLGSLAFFLLRLNARLAHMHPNAWPRLDLIPKCPSAVAEAVRQAIPSL